jgi:hypothetical protein
LTIKCTDYDQPLWTALIERGKPRRVREVFGTEWNRNSFCGRMQVVENMVARDGVELPEVLITREVFYFC